ncbi:5-demethoxyubiquinone hydroxylase, mitochondrial isoform X1 [Dermacentor silvarum]|uniref:5-demethoxyubiquinone hydroxylase, mitochondrial isoform X1 n=2 Tax=Dermacentor silvarum TaxID=543639 RepID=UPI002100A75B|nr:5-demethoxyubiquinone hydroxylase, mitochondrial isoform X1 [Dermacentor silvarum]
MAQLAMLLSSRRAMKSAVWLASSLADGDAVARLRRRRHLYDRILRVDHAGELGADRIYAGQMCVLGRDPVIRNMWEQEKEHLRAFERLLPLHRARPSALRPLWDSAGFALGFASALLGHRSAMACTVAVESVITEHYENQIRELLADAGEDHAELLDLLRRCRDDEQAHHDAGLEHGAEGAPLYALLTAAVKAGCRGAIWVAERV